MAQAERTPNQLINETSPYLLQHAYNPVEWYPWKNDALTKARHENKLILLSIGYSACHWCHVMEHESFEDQTTADLMNERFVCIKVDREERPDLDKIYQLAHQMMTQRAGGWPLTLFLTPEEHIPLFAGTYFPREPRYGMPGFMDIMQRVAAHYETHRDDLHQHNDAIRAAFTRIEDNTQSTQGDLSLDALQRACDELEQAYDPVDGGFGSAPKFPHPTNIERLLHHWVDQKPHGKNDERALEIALHTLRAMANGGIYDHLGGGFCRYSVDNQWAIPHFEKMLYDNAQLLPLYVDAFVISGDKQFLQVVNETSEWIMREMQSPDGGYYSTLDADSEGEEGKFYAWTIDELKNALNEIEWKIVETHYGLRGSPNFEGKWHLCARVPIQIAAKRLGIKTSEAENSLNSAREKLFAIREQRVRPGRDEKILTAWNGMMIKAMTHAGRWLQHHDWVDSAQSALDFVKNTLWQDERLLATTRDGKTHLNAYLDDYVWLADGILELL
ncbi:MAG: thioredoxin domain-containing protein, partial [Gammaproteobacteria bacterium]|nr:thioredoxin domain-containing protein [Gammaproteobacteria bacterium]